MQTLPSQALTPRVFQPYDQKQWPLKLIRYIWPVVGVGELVHHVAARDRGWAIFWAILCVMYYVSIIIVSERSRRLIVTPHGVSYILGDAILYAAWEDMERIDSPPNNRWRRTDGIYLRTARWRGRLPPLWRSQDSYIPLRSGGIPHWERRAYEALANGAPWLFTDAERR